MRCGTRMRLPSFGRFPNMRPGLGLALATLRLAAGREVEKTSDKDIKVKDAMVSNLVIAVLDDDLHDIAAVMVEKNIRHLPVLENSKVVGMLSIRDIIQTQVKKLTSEIHYLKDYITGF